VMAAHDRSQELGADVTPPDEPGSDLQDWIEKRFSREL
jgi:hypothetical protein